MEHNQDHSTNLYCKRTRILVCFYIYIYYKILYNSMFVYIMLLQTIIECHASTIACCRSPLVRKELSKSATDSPILFNIVNYLFFTFKVWRKLLRKMPKSNTVQQATNSQSKGYNLRNSAKTFPHESRSVVFLGVSRKRSDVKEARNRIGQRRVILLTVSKKQLNLNPGQLRLVSKRMLKTAKDLSSETVDTSEVSKPTVVEDAITKLPFSTDGKQNEEVQCLFFNCCDESDATPRSDSNSSDRCCWTTPINDVIDEDVTHVSGPADAILPPVPLPCPPSMQSFSGQPSVFGQLMVKRVRSECGDGLLSGSVEDSFFNDFLRDIRTSRI